MLVTSKRTKHLHNLPTIGNANISFKPSMKNFGFILVCHVAMNEHVATLARTSNMSLL